MHTHTHLGFFFHHLIIKAREIINLIHLFSSKKNRKKEGFVAQKLLTPLCDLNIHTISDEFQKNRPNAPHTSPAAVYLVSHTKSNQYTNGKKWAAAATTENYYYYSTAATTTAKK